MEQMESFTADYKNPLLNILLSSSLICYPFKLHFSSHHKERFISSF